MLWISNVHTDVKKHAIAHEGCTDTVGESALKVDSGRKILCGTGEWNLPQQHASSTLYQLSYVPTVLNLKSMY